MASFIVMSGNNNTAENDIRFVRDGFSVFAFAVPLVWLMWHRLWLHAALCFAAFGVAAALVAWSGNPIWIGLSAITSFLLSLYVALEGGEWVRQLLARDGFQELALISARTRRQAEEIFASGMTQTIVREPAKGFVPVSSVNLIPLTGL